MRMTRLFSQTLRDAPAEASLPGYQYLLRAGYIRQLAAGIFCALPLGLRALDKLAAILRSEMDAIGGQEVSLPVVHPAELWKESGRWYKIDEELGRMKDRNGRELALAMTHEEVVAALARSEVRSYRQLPQLIYQIQTKWRDDPRPRAGLIRAREFTMKDSYSLDADWAGLEAQYRAHFDAYLRIFARCSLPVIAVEADSGMMGGKISHEFMYLHPAGEDTLLVCDSCGYTANRQAARCRKPPAAAEAPLPVEPVATPDCKTIEELAAFLGVPAARTAKAVLLTATLLPQAPAAADAPAPAAREVFVFVIVRGDTEVNETKLANLIQARQLRPATEDEIRRAGAEPGYASPVGLGAAGSRPFLVVVDELIPASPNLAAGANRPGYHLLNVNYGRDFQADAAGDITAARLGDACPNCAAPLRAERGIEVGNIFQLGVFYSEQMGVTFTDADGATRPVVMGSYGIGLGRLLACIAEAHHDEHGLCLPAAIAPYQVHLTALFGKKKSPGEPDPSLETAEALYRQLGAAGIEVLYDDREESPGVKFNDADLIGLPLRITVSERARQAGGVELKRRGRAERSIAPLDAVMEAIRQQDLTGFLR